MATSTETSTVKVSEIEVPEGFNPRHEFDETALEQLAASIRSTGSRDVLRAKLLPDRYRLAASVSQIELFDGVSFQGPSRPKPLQRDPMSPPVAICRSGETNRGARI